MPLLGPHDAVKCDKKLRVSFCATEARAEALIDIDRDSRFATSAYEIRVISPD